MKISKIEENAFAVLTYRNAGRDGVPHRADLPLTTQDTNMEVKHE